MNRSRAATEWITRELPRLVEEHGVPGAQVAMVVNGELPTVGHVPKAPGGPVLGHDGAALGQYAFLRVVPKAGVAVALLIRVHGPRTGDAPEGTSQRQRGPMIRAVA